MTPSWYDVLGVEPGATSDEIRQAWKDSIAELDPTDRRFRLRNRAAEVLLDTKSRAAHDVELAADEGAEEGADELDEADLSDEPADVQAPPVVLEKTVPAPAKVTSPAPTEAHDDTERSGAVRPPVWLAAVLGVLALGLAIFAALAVVGASSASSGSSAGAAGDSALPDATQVEAARSAAEAAVGPVLSYDYRTLDRDKQEALSYMTPTYQAEYEKLFEGAIRVNAPTTKTVVSVRLLASGVVRTGPGRVDVLLFVNRPTANRQRSVEYHDQVTMRMVDQDGTWLADCLITRPDGICGE